MGEDDLEQNEQNRIIETQNTVDNIITKLNNGILDDAYRASMNLAISDMSVDNYNTSVLGDIRGSDLNNNIWGGITPSSPGIPPTLQEVIDSGVSLSSTDNIINDVHNRINNSLRNTIGADELVSNTTENSTQDTEFNRYTSSDDRMLYGPSGPAHYDVDGDAVRFPINSTASVLGIPEATAYNTAAYNDLATRDYVDSVISTSGTASGAALNISNGSGETLIIKPDGSFALNGKDVNIFELVNTVSVMEEKIDILMKLLPKKLGKQILQSKNKL